MQISQIGAPFLAPAAKPTRKGLSGMEERRRERRMDLKTGRTSRLGGGRIR
jgi:hypothetical protein